MLNPNKIVSVIAVYNDESRIARAIQSAAQSVVPDGVEHEIIVVDDASTDATLSVAKAEVARIAHAHILSTPQNGGPSAARNLALSQTDAGWFLPIDSDDVVEPQRLSTLYRIATESGADLVADNLFLSDESQPKSVVRVLWPGKPEGQVTLDAATFIRRCYAVECPRSELGYIKPLINRQAIKGAREPYLNDVRFGEDYELYCRMLLNGASALLVDPLGYYLVQREQSASRSQGAADHRRLAEINEQFLKRPNLSREEEVALRGFLAFSQREWAMWELIDAARSRSFRRAAGAMTISIDATLYVLRNVARSISRKVFRS